MITNVAGTISNVLIPTQCNGNRTICNADRISITIFHLKAENEMMELKFSKIISHALKGKNLSAIARELDMPRAMLHDWVKAKRVPSLNNIEYVKRLADYLNLSLEEILIGEETKKIISSVSFQDDSRQYKISVERIK